VPGRLYGTFDEGVARKIPRAPTSSCRCTTRTIGQAVIDQTEIGVVLSKEPPAKLASGRRRRDPNMTFVIRRAIRTTRSPAKPPSIRDTYLSTLYPHMHVRGKDATYTVIYPTEREDVVLRVPKYDFNWQLSSSWRAEIRAQRLDAQGRDALTNNSDGESIQPDRPTASVRWGDQTWEEMNARLLPHESSCLVRPPHARDNVKRGTRRARRGSFCAFCGFLA